MKYYVFRLAYGKVIEINTFDNQEAQEACFKKMVEEHQGKEFTKKLLDKKISSAYRGNDVIQLFSEVA